jgi:hypothetical protein
MWAHLPVSLNHIWEQEAEPLPGQAAPPVSDPMPPPAPGLITCRIPGGPTAHQGSVVSL